ncbi:hypothetical protein R6Q57_008251 [Mikania cordata]
MEKERNLNGERGRSAFVFEPARGEVVCPLCPASSTGRPLRMVELSPLLQGVQLTASIVAGCSTHPLDLIKVRMQLHGESVVVPNPNLRPAFAYSGTVAMPQPPPALARAGPVSIGVKIFQTEGVAALAGSIGAAVGNLADVAMVRTGTRLVVRTRRRRGLSGRDGGWVRNRRLFLTKSEGRSGSHRRI